MSKYRQRNFRVFIAVLSNLTLLWPQTGRAASAIGTIDHVDIFKNQASIFLVGGASFNCAAASNGNVARIRLSGTVGGTMSSMGDEAVTDAAFQRDLSAVLSAKLAGKTVQFVTYPNVTSGGDGGCLVDAITIF